MPTNRGYRPSQIYVDETRENIMPFLKKCNQDAKRYNSNLRVTGIEGFRKVKRGEYYLGTRKSDDGFYATGDFVWRQAYGYEPTGPRYILTVTGRP